MNRRNFIKTSIGAGVVGALSAGFIPAAANTSPAILKNTEYSWVRGFNYQPGYSAASGSGGFDEGTAWGIWRKLNLDAIEKELTRGKELFPKMNTLRIWLPYHVWLAQPEQFQKDFAGYLQIIGKLKLRAVPVLFNAWQGTPNFGGFRKEIFPYLTQEQLQKTFDYVTALFERHAEDETILVWDLCNEPDAYHGPELFPHLQKIYDHIKTHWQNSVLTINTMECRKANPMSDILAAHMYLTTDWAANTAEKYQVFIDGFVNYANNVGKALLALETCWPAKNDDSVKRIEDKLKNELRILNAAKVGWTAHALWESPVADIHRVQFGPRGEAGGYMGFINKDGSLREAHEAVNNFM